jgi:membrane fusion protein
MPQRPREPGRDDASQPSNLFRPEALAAKRGEWLGTIQLAAPLSGWVLSAIALALAATQTLLTVVPSGSELQAQLLVPSSGAGFVRAGDRVVLRYRVYPYQKFGLHYGRVAKVSRSALTPSEVAAITGQQPTEPLYRVAVKLDDASVFAYGKAEPLKAGMALDADILQERRRLIEWVFESLYGLGKRIEGTG